MKKLLTIFFVVIASLCYSQSKSILFIGNSYTYYNNGLENMLKELSASNGHDLEVQSVTVGGATFSNFCQNQTALNAISSKAWDYVVLQEQSQLPSFPPLQVQSQCYPYAKILSDSVHNNSACTQLLFFMTWGRQNGDSQNCNNYPPLCTYEGMQGRLTESYIEMAVANHGWAVPVGLAWKDMRDNFPEINLYDSDGSHPSPNGSYLAACTFYSVIFGESPEGSEYIYSLESDVAQVIQRVAYEAVRNNYNYCNMYDLSVSIEPKYIRDEAVTNYATITCAPDADSLLCDFGYMEHMFYPEDFTGGVLDLDMTQYIGYGTDLYLNVCVRAYRRCEAVSACQEFNYNNQLNCVKDNQDEIISFKNPISDGKINLSASINENIRIYSLDGKLMLENYINGNTIDVSLLKSGIYLLWYQDRTEKIIIE